MTTEDRMDRTFEGRGGGGGGGGLFSSNILYICSVYERYRACHHQSFVAIIINILGFIGLGVSGRHRASSIGRAHTTWRF